jgi:hypothetical protein
LRYLHDGESASSPPLVLNSARIHIRSYLPHWANAFPSRECSTTINGRDSSGRWVPLLPHIQARLGYFPCSSSDLEVSPSAVLSRNKRPLPQRLVSSRRELLPENVWNSQSRGGVPLHPSCVVVHMLHPACRHFCANKDARAESQFGSRRPCYRNSRDSHAYDW